MLGLWVMPRCGAAALLHGPAGGSVAHQVLRSCMAKQKEEALEVEGVVTQALGQHAVSRGDRGRPSGDRPRGGPDAQAFHPHRPRRQGAGGALALRPDQRPHHVPRAVSRSAFGMPGSRCELVARVRPNRVARPSWRSFLSVRILVPRPRLLQVVRDASPHLTAFLRRT